MGFHFLVPITSASEGCALSDVKQHSLRVSDSGVTLFPLSHLHCFFLNFQLL